MRMSIALLLDPPVIRAPQVDHTGMGPYPIVPFSSQPEELKGPTLYSQMGVNLIVAIKNLKKRKASSEVLAALTGPPAKRDPTNVKLKGTGWAMAQRLFDPQDVWLTKDANAFMAKNLTVVPK